LRALIQEGLMPFFVVVIELNGRLVQEACLIIDNEFNNSNIEQKGKSEQLHI
jgi:hypothetical protein